MIVSTQTVHLHVAKYACILAATSVTLAGCGDSSRESFGDDLIRFGSSCSSIPSEYVSQVIWGAGTSLTYRLESGAIEEPEGYHQDKVTKYSPEQLDYLQTSFSLLGGQVKKQRPNESDNWPGDFHALDYVVFTDHSVISNSERGHKKTTDHDGWLDKGYNICVYENNPPTS